MTEFISRQAALAEIDKNREALLQSGMKGAEHILVHYGRRVVEELPSIDVSDTKVWKWIPCKKGCEYWDGESGFCALQRPADLVRHGGWIKMSDAYGVYWACSECGEELPRINHFDPQFDLLPRLESIDRTNYCPNCGAQMEVEE